MSDIVQKSLQRIAKGTGIILISTIVRVFSGFGGIVTIVRYLIDT